MAIKFLNSIESITLPGTTTDYYIGGSGGGVASNALKIGSRTTNNTIAMELFHALNPVSLGISYSGGDALAFIDSVHSSFDSVLQFKTGGDERFRVGALNANTFQIKPASAGNDVSITDNSGNAILYSDTSTQRIGIGTTSPSSKLQVSANDGDGITLQHGASNAFYILRSGNDDTIIKQTRNYTSKISISTLADSGTHESSGLNIVGQGVGLKSNIGIGTDSPSEKLHVDGNLRVTGAYYDSNNAPGTLDQVLTSTATGVAWVDPSTITAEAATLVVIECKNTSGATIAKGTPVYQTGTVGATDVIEIAPADALISSGSQPAIGLLQTTLNNNGFGKVVITGEFLNFTTDPIDGVTPTTGDKVFLKSGGGLTLTKPTGAENGIQNLGLIGKVSGGNAGSITVSSIMRTNDVPNLPTGKIWVGDGNTIVSDTVFLDEPNGRMGIGTTSPTKLLEVKSSSAYDSTVRLSTIAHNWDIQGGEPGYSSTAFALDYDGTTFFRAMGATDARFSGGLSVGTVNAAPPTGGLYVAGNVGIGTTSPTKKLEVMGELVVNSGFNTGVSSLYLSHTDNSGQHKAGIFTTYTTGYGRSSSMQFALNNQMTGAVVTTADAKMTILEGGNVGIGTASPSEKLDVDGNILADGLGIGNNTIYSNSINLNNAGSLRIGNAEFISKSSNDMSIFQSKMVVTSAGNVGIGTTAPGAKLQINSTTGWGLFTERGIKDGSTSSYGHSYGAGNAHILGRAMYFESVAVFSTSTADATTKEYRFKNSADKLIIESLVSGATIDNNILVLSGSNVGIGTASPARTLDVAGRGRFVDSTGTVDICSSTYVPLLITNTNGYAHARINGFEVGGNTTANNEGYIKTSDNSRKLILDTNGWRFLAQSAELMRITSTGNVGIGTTSPGEKLEVAGDMNLYNPSATSQINFRNIGGANYIKSNGYATHFGLRGNAGNGVFIIEDSFATNQDIRIKPTTSGWDFSSRGVAGVNALLTIDSVLNISNKTNVGIGTTSPDRPLSVVGGNSMVARFQSTNTTSFIQFSNTVSTADQVRIGSNGTNLVLSTNYAEKMRITSAGNVGIGTTSPDYPLHVDDTVKIGDRQGTDGSLILQSQQGPNITFKSTGDILDISGTTGATNGNSIRLSDNIKKLYFNGGIGGTIAINRGNRGLMDSNVGGLEVQQQDTASSNGKSTFLSTSSLGTILRSTSYGSTGTSGDIQFQFGGGANTSEPSPTTKMIIKNSGNVGIGTTSPSEKLEVAGKAIIRRTGSATMHSDTDLLIADSTATGSTAAVQILGGSAGFSNIQFSDTDGYSQGAIMYGHSGDYMLFKSNASEKMRITSTGNVGIGTTSPSEKLHVEGDIRLLDELIFGEYSTTTDRLTNQSYALTMAHSTALNFKVGTTSVFNVYGTQIRPQVNNTVDFGHSGFRWKRGYFAGNLIANSIGIGTDFPSDELTIEAESPTIRLKDISSSNYAEFYVNDFDTYLDSAGRTFIQSGGSTNVTVTSAGNVGIGTTTPSTPLHINADAPTIRLQDATSGDNHYLTGNNGELRVQSSGYITMRPGAAVSTTFLANGNVGIGTTSPSSPLHIKFNSTSTTFPTGAGDFLKVENTNTTVDTHSSISLRSGTADSFISTVYKGINIGDLVFNLDNGGVAEKMRILANGNVGIGTDSPSQKLEVDGEVLSDGYRVSAMQTAPAARNSTGTLGEIRITSNYIYVCYATNSWSRVALATSW